MLFRHRFFALLVAAAFVGCGGDSNESAAGDSSRDALDDSGVGDVSGNQDAADLRDASSSDGAADTADVDNNDSIEPDVPGADLNRCGGTVALTLDGVLGEPGETCGACNDGISVCNGPDALRCVGASEQNACGGCFPLASNPDDPCGVCGDGAWTCDPLGKMECVGATLPNACGGCESLIETPGWQCVASDGSDGTWTCLGTNEVICIGGGLNVCGGTVTLGSRPGSPCGACGLGVVECDGPDALRCSTADEEDIEANACGGCSPLEGAPGSECGACGAWECDPADPEAVVCVEERNECGGCSELAASPGQTCDVGTYICTSEGELECATDSGNACGGETVLNAEPGESCGLCGAGITRCASPELVACVGSRAPNECGGCGLLSGVVGNTCGNGATWQCGEENFVTCEIDTVQNACGGSTVLDNPPGAVCPTCNVQNNVCIGPNETICIGDLNACGGCGILIDPATGEISSPGVRCGTCDSGRLTCTPEGDALLCVGDRGEEAYLVRYVDSDGDGFGDESEPRLVCDDERGLVDNSSDCDDSTDAITLPNECGGCEAFFETGEGPGFPCGTCGSGRYSCLSDDELFCSGDLGDGALVTYYVDADDDGYGDPDEPRRLCSDEDGVVDNSNDCNDGDDSLAFPNACGGCSHLEGALGTLCEGCGSWECAGFDAVVCNTASIPTWYPDADEDGFVSLDGATTACTRPDGYRDIAPGERFDCDDSTGTVFPGADEIVGDEIDQNCDGVERCYVDADGDGFADASDATRLSDGDSCPVADGLAPASAPRNDCNDGLPEINPEALEVCDGVDNDCNGFRDDGICDGSCTPSIIDNAAQLFVPCGVSYIVDGRREYSDGVLIDGTLLAQNTDIVATDIRINGLIDVFQQQPTTSNSGFCEADIADEVSLENIGGTPIDLTIATEFFTGGAGAGSAGDSGRTEVSGHLESYGLEIPVDTSVDGREAPPSCQPNAGGTGGCSGILGGGRLRLHARDSLILSADSQIRANGAPRPPSSAVSLDSDASIVGVFELFAIVRSYLPSPSGGGGTISLSAVNRIESSGELQARGSDGFVDTIETTITESGGLPLSVDINVDYSLVVGGGGGGSVRFVLSDGGVLEQADSATIDVSGGEAAEGYGSSYAGEPGVVHELVDNDGDGYATVCAIAEHESDCNDSDPNVFPGAPDVIDGIDNDCDGETDEDSGIGGACGDDITCLEGVCSNGFCVPDGMVYVPAGSFTQGAQETLPSYRSDEVPQHVSTLTHALAVGEFEVTQAEWESLMGTRPFGFDGCGDRCPAESISFPEAVAFANARSRAEGLIECYNTLCSGIPGEGLTCSAIAYSTVSPYVCNGYRLPTEAEWEYFARGGRTTHLYAGDIDGDADTVFFGIVYSATSPSAESWATSCATIEEPGRTCAARSVDSTSSNPYGIYGVAGNVREWTGDVVYDYTAGESVDAYEAGLSALDGTSTRVVRGASWADEELSLRHSRRWVTSIDFRSPGVGFRLVRSLD